MPRIVVYEWMALDGVVQAPGASEEDTAGGFRHGGWHLPYFDDMAREWVGENLSRAGGFVLGRRTYEILGGYWPHASDEEQALARPLNTLPKYVASATLSEPLAWQNSKLLGTDVVGALKAMKDDDGSDLLVLGSTVLVETLIEHDLVDEFRMMIDPVTLGGGKRIFPDDGVLRRLQMVDCRVTTTGAIIATYVLAGR